MKLIRSILCIFISMMLVLPMTVSAASVHDQVVQNDPVETPKATPTVDGVISVDDGWSSSAKMARENVKNLFDYKMDMAIDADIYFAYDETGLYYAADIRELPELDGEETLNSFMYSTREDYLDRDKNYKNIMGFEGDVFILGLDPLGLYLRNGYISTTDFTAWYCVGLFEGDQARMFRTQINNGDITDQVDVSGMATDYGWRFEAHIPWERIIEDMEAYTYGRATCTVEELTRGGAEFRSAVIYADRIDDPELGEVNTRGVYMTSASVTHDGSPSHLINGCHGGLYGLNFYIQENEHPFTDVADGIWYDDAVRYCYNRNYMSGTNATSFSPNTVLTREMFVRVLANLDGADLSAYTESSFSDVPSGQWYTAAIEWAYDNGLTSGISPDTFGLGGSVTREQLATFMIRYAKYTCKNVTGSADLSSYSDRGQISGWAKDGVSWMVYKGFIKGVGESNLAPKAVATRSQFALIITNYMKEYGLSVF